MSQDLWGAVDYGPLGERLAPAGERLVTALGPGAGDRLLDIAAGRGQIAEAAAERGATVTAVDGSPAMVAAGRARLDGCDLAVTWRVGDLAALPVEDRSVELAASSFGLIFAARPSEALAEVARVLVPGGRLGLTAWTADGVMGRMTRAMGPYFPVPPPDAAPGPDPFAWGDAAAAQRLLTTAGFTDVRVEVATLPWSFPDAGALTTFFREHSPAHAAVAAAAADRAGEMWAAVEAAFAPDGGPVDVAAEYLLVTARSAR